MSRQFTGNTALPNNSLVAVLDLPDSQRQLVIWLMRQGPATLANVANHFEISLEDAQFRIEELLTRGYAELTDMRTTDPHQQQYCANVDLFRRGQDSTDQTAQDIATTRPISAILGSSGKDLLTPGTSFELSVTASNKGSLSAVIDVFLDDLSPTMHPWCRNTQTRLALSPSQNGNVIFQFEIPPTALPGTYRYWVVVDAPQHYPDAPPLRYEQVLQVMPPTETATQVKDPTFVLLPPTRSSKPAKTLPGSPITFQVGVYNRTDRVDRFRLSCPDLPEDWVTIDYPQGFQSPGLVIPESYLDLNPAAEGLITLTITPPADAIATTHIATLRLKSDNHPHLNLLEVLYLEILPVYQVDLGFRTIISRIQTQAATYSIQSTNRGNTPRKLSFQVKPQEDAKLFDFSLDPEHITLAPKQTLTTQVQVKPIKPLRRPFIGGGRVVNFNVTPIDDETLPLPEIPMQGLLIWQARPWWQVMPVFLLLFGSIIGLILLTWWFFIRPPESPKILGFSPENTEYAAANGDAVRLGFQLSQPKRIRSIQILGQSIEGTVLSGPLTFDLSQGLPKALEPFCTLQPKVLTCRNLRTDARRPGDYTFTLSITPKAWRNARSTQQTSPQVTIAPLPLPEILELFANQSVYPEAPPVKPTENSEEKATPQTAEPTPENPTDSSKAEPFNPSTVQQDPHVVRLNWQISNPQYLRGLMLVGKAADGNAITPLYQFDFRQGLPPELASFCTLDLELICQNVPTGAHQIGDYLFELQAIPASGDVTEPIIQVTAPVQIQPRPPQLLTFTINGEPAQPNYLIPIDQGQPPIDVIVTWDVEQNAGTQVSLLPAPGNVPLKGSIPVPLSPEAGETIVTLAVTNPLGEQLTRSVTITTYDPTPGPDTVVINGETAPPAPDAGGAGAGGADNGSNGASSPIPRRPGQVAPQELPPQFD